MMTKRLTLQILSLTAVLFPALASAQTQTAPVRVWAAANPVTPAPPHEIQAPGVEQNLKNFDTLDFDVFSNQKWERLAESHSKDIVVTWPDGHETRGLEPHIKDLANMFTFAPDLKITEHPIRFGSGSFTGASGIMHGTFTKPMVMANGTVIKPTGKKFALGMFTVGHWVGGVMDHEWLYYDNQDFMNQLGLGK